ncbi:MAG TPA: PEP/pyruvate-binding domain-containing protein [Steroidobacteraceae bacterium]|nr:PEP/pyruvate-binding domain-containing protein [Steroidobacteraceae bacterium]
MSSESSQVFLIGCGPGGPAAGGVEVMGFKAFNLARMAQLGIPVPPAFVLGTRWCGDFLASGGHLSDAARNQVRSCVRYLEHDSGLGFGSQRRPLLLSVRSGAPVSMPGMLDTVLNVGLCDSTIPGLLRLTGNPRLAWDSYRRLVLSFAEVVKGVEPAVFNGVLREVLRSQRVERVEMLDFRGLRELTARQLEAYATAVGESFPQSPAEQLDAAVAAVFASWNSAKAVAYRRASRIADDLGTAVTVQRMVFGNSGGNSGAGVAFTRDPATGEDALYLDFAFNAQGEDVVSGRTALEHGQNLSVRMPEVSAELQRLKALLEREFRDAQEFEFTVENGRLLLLQTRAAKRTPLAALRIAVEQLDSGLITPAEARRHLEAVDLAAIEIVQLTGSDGAVPLATGIAASVGVACGQIVLDPERVVRFAQSGAPVLLVREDMATSDVVAIHTAVGILTAHGGRTSHAAVVARQLGKPCIVGCNELRVAADGRTCSLGGRTMHEGEVLSLDANTGTVFAGEPRVRRERPTALLDRLDHHLSVQAAPGCE